MSLRGTAGPTVRRKSLHSLGGAFVGPLDGLPAPQGAYSVRRLLTSYAANKALNVRRASDNATLDVGFLANGDLDVPSLTTFLAATTGFVAKWYDQSGNLADLLQATAANQPQVNIVGNFNSKPSVTFVRASTHFMASVGTTTPVLTADATYAAATRSVSFSINSYILDKRLNRVGWYQNNTGQDKLIIPGVADGTTTGAGKSLATNYISGATRIGTALAYYQNGATNGTGVLAGATSTGTVMEMGGQGGTQLFDGELPEVMVWDSGLSGANFLALMGAMNAYYAVY